MLGCRVKGRPQLGLMSSIKGGAISHHCGAEELEVSLSTLDRKIRNWEVEVRREGRRVFVRMVGEYITDEELLRRAVARERELERTVRELEQIVSELKLRASERERDEARESAATARLPYHELEREYQKEVAEHRVTPNPPKAGVG